MCMFRVHRDKSMHRFAINPCTFHERRTCLLSSAFHTVRVVRPLRTWPSLVFTRLRQRVRGEHRYVSDIEVEKEQAASTSHTRIAPNVAWTRLYQPPYAFRAAWASCWLCFLCCEKQHSCSLLRGIHSHAFLMEPAILHRPSEARVDNPALLSALYDSPHTPGLGLAWE